MATIREKYVQEAEAFQRAGGHGGALLAHHPTQCYSNFVQTLASSVRRSSRFYNNILEGIERLEDEVLGDKEVSLEDRRFMVQYLTKFREQTANQSKRRIVSLLDSLAFLIRPK